MGNPVAMNLLTAGHDLSVHDLDPSATDNLVAAGAAWCEDAAQAARSADVVLLSLPSHLEVEDVCFGAGGVFSTIRPGSYLIDLTTVSISLIPRLVQAQPTYGVRYLTSPVSQGVDNARAGKLSVFVGGDRADYEHCRPIYDTISTTTNHTGITCRRCPPNCSRTCSGTSMPPPSARPW
jgi:3-hydroxyisobutyrate dehydrogenase-like beta-hydroxyacid dehydrogenase